MNILLLDNLDSFTYNLVDLLSFYKHKVFVYNNLINLNIILNFLLKFKKNILILGAGPGLPKNSGCMFILIKKIIGFLPIIGICLGFQALIEYFSGSLLKYKKIMHGRTSLIKHDNIEMYNNLPNPLIVARYHSYICKKLPSPLIMNSYYKNIIMSFRNNINKLCGYQFHPESILTPCGALLLNKTISWCYF